MVIVLPQASECWNDGCEPHPPAASFLLLHFPQFLHAGEAGDRQLEDVYLCGGPQPPPHTPSLPSTVKVHRLGVADSGSILTQVLTADSVEVKVNAEVVARVPQVWDRDAVGTVDDASFIIVLRTDRKGEM